MKTQIRPLAFSIALLHSPFVFSADNPDVLELDAITISASRSETRVEEMALHTKIGRAHV